MVEAIRARLAEYAAKDLDDGGLPRAAVLIALYERDQQQHVLLTVRTELVEHHKAQISFPGGARDPDDADLVATALRETEEEIGVRAEHIDVLGRLDDILTISNFIVTPYIGRVTEPAPYPFVPNTFEVAEILEVPLGHLHGPDALLTEPAPWHDRMVPPPAYRFGHHIIWGATARILRQFLALAAGPK